MTFQPKVKRSIYKRYQKVSLCLAFLGCHTEQKVYQRVAMECAAQAVLPKRIQLPGPRRATAPLTTDH